MADDADADDTDVDHGTDLDPSLENLGSDH